MPQIRIEKSDRFTQVENVVIQNPDLSLKAKGLLVYMLSVPKDWDYSISGLSLKCKEGKAAIRSAIDELIAAGHIVRRLARGKDGTISGYEYTVYESPHPSCENCTTEEDAQPSCGFPSSDYPSSENCTEQINNITKEEVINTPYSPPLGDEDPKPKKKREPAMVAQYSPQRFEQFWEIYPGGGSRARAVAAWDKLKPDDGLIDTMARALHRQMKSQQWQDGIGIPHASTWLNQKRWTDKLPPPKKIPPPTPSGGWAADPEVM